MTVPSHLPSRRLVPRGRRERPAPTAPQLPMFGVVDRTIDGRFAAYHARHPEVYDELVRLARQAREAGREKVGIGMLFEVVRWNAYVRLEPGTFKLNNVYRSRYARLIMEQEPDLDGLFDTRELRS